MVNLEITAEINLVTLKNVSALSLWFVQILHLASSHHDIHAPKHFRPKVISEDVHDQH